MSLLPNQVAVNENRFFFLRAEGQTISVSSINSNNISSGTINVGSGIISSLSTNNIDAEYINNSTINTIAVDIDGQILTATPTDLLLNGIPIATASSLSSIQDWSIYPAISTLDMNANNIITAGNVSSTGIQAGNALFGNLVAINAMFISSYTSTISASVFYADVGDFSTLNVSDHISAPSITCSSIKTIDVSAATIEVSTLTAGNLNVSSIGVSSLNWAQYAAQTNVNMAGNSLLNVSSIISPSTIEIVSQQRDINIMADDVLRQTASLMSIGVDGGANILSNGAVRIGAVNGGYGEISLRADTGYANNGGKVNIDAIGGVTPLGVAYGGEVNITATTGGSFTSLAFTSAVNLNAAGINIYAGATNAIGSVAGYDFIHGDLGVNLTAGVPPILPNDPATIYLYGTNGVLVFSPMYVKGAIRPYSDLTNNPEDLYIEAYSNLITKGYIQLRGVSTQTFEGGDTAILGLNRIAFSTAGGAVENLSSVNGIPISAYQNISSISSLNEWAFYPALSTIAFSTGVAAVIQSANPASDPMTLNAPIYTMPGNMNLGTEVQINGNTPGYVALYKQGATPSTIDVLVKDVLLKPDNTTTPVPFYYLSTANRLAWTDQTTLSPSIVEVANVRDLVSTFSTQNVVASTLSCATILGANPNIFGNILSTPGLVIEAPNVFLSTPQVIHPGNFNGSTMSLTQGNIRSVIASSITTSSINFFQSGAFGLSSIMSLSTANIPGQGTSTTLYTNTDFSLGQNDLYAQQIRVGYNSIGGSALSEVIFYAPDGTNRALGLGSQDATIRLQSTANSGLNNGYLLDTFINKPFFSTINNSTCMMATIPSTNLGVFGVSTLSVIPPINVFGSFYSSTSQQVAGANTITPLTYNSEALNVGGLTFAGSTINVPIAGTYSITHSVQFDTTSGGTNTAQFWVLKNGAAIPQTNSIVSITNNGDTLGTIEVLDTAAANDKYGIAIYSADPNMTANANPAGATPAVPSIITTIKRLG